MVTIKMNTKMFFDRDAVISRLAKAEVRILSRQGAIVRKQARQSIKRRKKAISKPGNPPYTHTGDIKRIAFQYEPETHSVIVGIMKFNAKHSTGTAMTVPELLEHGGEAILWRDGKKHTWAPRPTMGPALEQVRPQLAEAWRNAIK